MIEFYYRSPQLDITPETLNHPCLRHALYCLGSFLRGDILYKEFTEEICEINGSKNPIALFEIQWYCGGIKTYFGFTCGKQGIYEEWLKQGDNKIYCRKKEVVHVQRKEIAVPENVLVMSSQEEIKQNIIYLLVDFYKEVSKNEYK